MNRPNEIGDRKKDHIELTALSQVNNLQKDNRFNYEPIFSNSFKKFDSQIIQGKTIDYPIWISSMTGGTPISYDINRRLAKVCQEYNLGMALGSCRVLFDKEKESVALRNLISENT